MSSKPKKPRKAGFIRKIWISLKMIGSTLFASLDSFVIMLTARNRRKRTDSRLVKWSGRLLKHADLRFEVINSSGFTFQDDKPYVLMSNHLSHLDIPLIFMAFPHQSVRMLTKKELFKVPVWGKAMRLAEFISIDRKNQKQAWKDLEFAKNLMKSGIRLWVAPEGTRSKDGKLQQLKRGGFKIASDMKATILPIGIVGSNLALPAGKLEYTLGHQATIRIGRPIEADGGPESLPGLIAEVETQLREMTTP